MSKVTSYLKSNPLVVILTIALAFLLYKQFNPIYGVTTSSYSVPIEGKGITSVEMTADTSSFEMMPTPISDVAPVLSPTRMTVYDTSLAMQVKDVKETLGKIETLATTNGGYLVDSNLSQPDSSANGNATIRVPLDKRANTLESLRTMGIKVVSENNSGYDVTDQYTDLDARLATLKKTYAKFNSMLDESKTVQDTLQVQRELINIQAQIDSIVGQQKYLDATSKLTRISVSLATDDLSLPYTPDQAWRPTVIFKQATRSLLLSLRSLGNGIIWLAVYSPFWGAALVGYFFYRKRRKQA